MEQPFSYSVYQQGKKLYQNMKVSDVHVNGSIVEGRVMDHKMHKVKLVFTNERLTAKYCSCAYAKVYEECQHTAALYIAYTNKANTPNKSTLRDLYAVYIASKARIKKKDYEDFELQVLKKLRMMVSNRLWDEVRGYCEELSSITYPVSRINILINQMMRSLNTLRKDEKLSALIYQWSIDSLSLNKNKYFHDYFINLLRTKPSDEIQMVCEDLLMNQVTVSVNPNLCTKILLLLKENTTMTCAQFIKKYSSFKNSEAMIYLQAQEWMSNKEYEKSMKYLASNHDKFKTSSLQKKMQDLYEMAVMMRDPNEYMFKLIDRMSYWYPDLSEFMAAKNKLQSQWSYICDEIYDYLRHSIDLLSFKNLIYEEDEWNYALYLIYKEPTFENIDIYGALIQKKDKELFYEVQFEVLMNAADKGRNVKTYEDITAYLRKIIEAGVDSERIEYMLYYMKKANPNKNKLIELLDDIMEDAHKA